MSKPQRLCFRAVEFSPVEDSDGRTLEGYAAVFNTPTKIQEFAGRFTEEIAPGAFAKTLSERKPVLQFDHGRDVRTGSVPIGKILEAKEDERGLYIKARMFDNATVEPIRQAIEGGAIDGMSFRFRVNRDSWRDQETGRELRGADLEDALASDQMPARTIQEVELYEAGPVVFPAYEATSVGVRSMLTMLSEDEREELLAELLGRAKPVKKGKKPSDSDEEEEKDPKGKKPGSDKEDPKGKKPTGSDKEEEDEDEDDPKAKGKKKPFGKKESKSASYGYEARSRALFML